MNERPLRTLLTLLGLVQLAIGCWMTFATNSFGERVAPFDHVDLHDLRDFATYFLALGIVLLLAAARPGWRFPILALATLEYALHTINHAVDISHSHPAWVGPADLAAVATATVAFAGLAWLTRPCAYSDSERSETSTAATRARRSSRDRVKQRRPHEHGP
jgi:hypothetical protein